MKELNLNEMREISGGILGWSWGVFLKATLAGGAIGGSVYVARMV